jgi:hypothetical protein
VSGGSPSPKRCLNHNFLSSGVHPDRVYGVVVHGGSLSVVANIQRIPVSLTIPGGGAGLAQFYAADTDTTAVAALGTFWAAVKNLFPAGFSYSVPGTGDKIDELTGHVTDIWTQSGSSSGSSASGVGPYAAGTGMRVRWHTGGIVHFRRVVGSTFLAPFNAASYDNDGTIIPATVSSVQTAASALVSGANCLIWSPPVTAAQATDKIPQRDGSSHLVLAGIAVDHVASLRSRRV